jgi:hypothetical protein
VAPWTFYCQLLVTLTSRTTIDGITLTSSTPFVTFSAEFAREVTYLLTTNSVQLCSSLPNSSCSSTRTFITAVHQSGTFPFLSQLDPIYALSVYLKSILILSSHLNLVLPSGLTPTDCPVSTCRSHKATRPAVDQPDKPNVLLGSQIMTQLISVTEHLHNLCTNINLHSEGTLPHSPGAPAVTRHRLITCRCQSAPLDTSVSFC